MLSDIRCALRLLRRSPGFSAVAILTLALGVGVNTAVFSLTDGMLFRPLPFGEPDRLVRIQTFDPRTGQVYSRIDRVDVEQIEAHHTGFEGLALMEHGRSYTRIGTDGAESISSTQVTPNLLTVLKVNAFIGRALGPGDGRLEPRPVMISYDAWRRRFGGDPAAVGRTVIFEQGALHIVGVLPPRFIIPLTLGADGEMLVPQATDPSDAGNLKAGTWAPVARLKAGVSIEAAQAEVDMLVRRSVELYPEAGMDRYLRVADLQFALFEHSRPLLWLLMGAAGFVVLIAFTNLGSLLMARGIARQQEIGIRAAMGASRGRLVRQLLVESQVIAAAGAAVSLLVASWTFQLIASQVPAGSYRLMSEGLDARAMVFAVAASLGCGAIFGMLPALRLSMPNLDTALRGRRSRTHVAGATRAGALLVTAEVSLGLILLCGAGLMVNSLVRARTVDLGYEPSRAVMLSVFPSPARYPTPADRYQYQMQLLESVRQLPGVTMAGAIETPQIGGIAPPIGLGADAPRGSGLWGVTPGYFAAMQTPILAGRDFTEREGRGYLPVVLVNETAAAFFWPGERDIVGRTLHLDKHPPLDVVGVVKDVRYGYGRGSVASVYRPAGPDGHRTLTIVARAAGDPAAAGALMRTAGQRLDPTLVIGHPDTIANSLQRGIADSRFQTTLLGLFAGLGLVLTAIGIYGVIAFWVSGRTREMGIRLALGAEPHAVKRLVVRQALVPVLGGLGLGLAGAFVLTRRLQSLLYEVAPHDPATLIAAVSLLLAVAFAAAYIPARRASRVNPVEALGAD